MINQDLILSHFKKVDSVLHQLAIKHSDPKLFDYSNNQDYFVSLCQSIVNQQLSTLAAAKIWGRLCSIFPENNLEPALLLETEISRLREVGLSQAKSTYLYSLAQAFNDNLVEFNSLDSLSDQEVISKLTQIKGVGVWTAEMFLIFTLGRPDVFSLGDRGLMRALEKTYGIETTDKSVVEKIIKPWSPFRSFAAKILWRSLDNQPNR